MSLFRRTAKGARPASRHGSLKAWLRDHARVSITALGRLYRQPLSGLMTVAVIGIALSLPASLEVLVQNARQVSGDWEGAARLSLYLKPSVNDADARTLADQLQHMPGVDAVQLITADQALAEFKKRSGYGDAVELLDQNPLPSVLVVKPAPAYTDPEAAAGLQQQLAQLPAVAEVHLDLQWLQRLTAILEVVHRLTWILATLLGLGVILVIGNTIRLEIGSRRAEIEVSKLLGATDAFIRRPFLYHGAWFGLAGGFLAALLVILAVVLMEGPVGHLASLYGAPLSLQSGGLDQALDLLAIGALLGWAGSWLAVARHLRAIEPS